MEKASQRRKFRPTILPKGGGIILQIWSNPLLFPLFTCMGVGGAKTLIGA